MAVCTSLRTAHDQMLIQKTQHLASLSVLKFHVGTLYNIQLFQFLSWSVIKLHNKHKKVRSFSDLFTRSEITNIIRKKLGKQSQHERKAAICLVVGKSCHFLKFIMVL